MTKPKELHDIAKRLKTEGRSMGNIAKILGVSKQIVSKWLSDKNLPKNNKKTGRPRTSVKKEELIVYVATKAPRLTLDEIKKITNVDVCRSTIYNILKRYNMVHIKASLVHPKLDLEKKKSLKEN
jgi:transposase